MREKELRNNPQLIELLPDRVTVEGIKNDVKNVNDFRRIVGYANDRKRGRPSKLDRILKSVNPDALEFRESDKLTNYQHKEKQYNIRADRRRQKRELAEERKRRADEGLKPIEEMSEAEYATFISDTDMDSMIGEPDDEYYETDEERRARWEAEDAERKRVASQVESKVEVYLGVWKDPKNRHHLQEGYDELINAMEWMQREEPAYLLHLFNRGDQELIPDYIYINTKTLAYLSESPETRHDRAVAYVIKHARRVGWNG
jgi:hypothetical protein